VLLVPYAGNVETIGERILVAWKDTREAARAVGDAMPFLRQARFVQALTVRPKDDEAVETFIAEQQLKHFFALRELDVTVKRIVAADVNAGEFLLSQAADTSADLIVMGGYSQRRIRELIWGGVTRTMLRSMTVPVLMSH
jgi:nucleotide-binding universal stress UspA family protein